MEHQIRIQLTPVAKKLNISQVRPAKQVLRKVVLSTNSGSYFLKKTEIKLRLFAGTQLIPYTEYGCHYILQYDRHRW